jgi:hypothetical protein
MSSVSLLLGAGSGDLLELLFVLAIFAIGIISKILQKTAKDRQEQERARTGRRYKPIPPPVNARPPVGAGRETIPPRQDVGQRAPNPAVLARKRAIAQQRENTRQELLQLKRQKAAAAAAAATVAAAQEEQRQVSARKTVARQQARPQSKGLLKSLTAARRAIIYHEIFSPPKALRDNDELWDFF